MLPSTTAESQADIQELIVDVPAGPSVPMLVQLPPRYVAATLNGP